MIADVHEGTMASGSLTSLASHGHRRTRSAVPWTFGASAARIQMLGSCQSGGKLVSTSEGINLSIKHERSRQSLSSTVVHGCSGG